MPIIAKNITVGAVAKPAAPTETSKGSKLSDIKELVKKKLAEKEPLETPKKRIKEVNTPPQVTKELPKYVTKEHGELTRKINTKSQYMRDIFDLDS